MSKEEAGKKMQEYMSAVKLVTPDVEFVPANEVAHVFTVVGNLAIEKLEHAISDERDLISESDLAKLADKASEMIRDGVTHPSPECKVREGGK